MPESEIQRIIGEEIRSAGVISFARFMEVALYCPVYGFYEKEADRIGRRGDFFTSVSVGPLFGELLAFQFGLWLEEIAAAGAVALMEGGAHDGRLAMDILQSIHAQAPGLYERLVYILVENSPKRKGWQEQLLSGHKPRVRWVEEIAGAPKVLEPGTPLIMFSNELLDAFPVHRLEWRSSGRHWVEWGVAEGSAGLQWQRMATVSPAALAMLPSAEIASGLPDGYIIELSPAAAAWWQTAASVLDRGRLVAIDYGLTAEDRFLPERTTGTLRAYSGHSVSRDVLENPGEQDITAHVDFEMLKRVGERAGLRTEIFAPQGRALTEVAAKIFRGGGRQWDPARIRQFKTLTHPEHMGASFKMLVQRTL